MSGARTVPPPPTASPARPFVSRSGGLPQRDRRPQRHSSASVLGQEREPCRRRRTWLILSIAADDCFDAGRARARRETVRWRRYHANDGRDRLALAPDPIRRRRWLQRRYYGYLVRSTADVMDGGTYISEDPRKRDPSPKPQPRRKYNVPTAVAVATVMVVNKQGSYLVVVVA